MDDVVGRLLRSITGILGWIGSGSWWTWAAVAAVVVACLLLMRPR